MAKWLFVLWVDCKKFIFFSLLIVALIKEIFLFVPIFRHNIYFSFARMKVKSKQNCESIVVEILRSWFVWCDRCHVFEIFLLNFFVVFSFKISGSTSKMLICIQEYMTFLEENKTNISFSRSKLIKQIFSLILLHIPFKDSF